MTTPLRQRWSWLTARRYDARNCFGRSAVVGWQVGEATGVFAVMAWPPDAEVLGEERHTWWLTPVRNTAIVDKRASPDRLAESVELSIPQAGIVFDGLVLRLPTNADLDRMPPTFAEPDALTRADFAELIPRLRTLVASGQLVPLVIAEVQTGEILGGGTFRHLDSKGAMIEIGYWLYPDARGRGVATKTARALAQHAFGLGIRRVVAHVKVGNNASDRVLERAGFTREGVSRSMPTADGGRIDKTVWSLLPGD